MTKTHKFSTVQIVRIGAAAAIICILAPFSIPIPISPVPITLATLVLYFLPYILGWKHAVISCFIYLLLGTVGLPVFAGFSGGIADLAGPTGGYLIGFLFLTAISGLAVEYLPGKRLFHIIGMAAATAVDYTLGTIWLGYMLQLNLWEALVMGVLPYLIGDSLKIAAAVVLGPVLRKRLDRAGVTESSHLKKVHKNSGKYDS